jgi:phage tail-like protein
VGSATWIAIDCVDNVYVVVTGPPDEVRRINPDGSIVVVDSNPNNLTAHFPVLPFAIDADGLIHLRSMCGHTAEGHPQTIKCPPKQAQESGLFDLQGNAVYKCAGPILQRYLNSGVYISEALDSELYRCQWHRVILRGEIPAGSTVYVSTYTAEAELDNSQIAEPGINWETNQLATEVTDEWDCLVRNGGGRFLWLKLEFKGNGKSSPRIDSITIEFPRISLRRYLPAVFGEEPTSADFTDRFLSLFDTTIRSIEIEIDQQARLYDPLSTPSKRSSKSSIDFLSWLASWIGITLDRNWTESKRRRFLKDAGRLFDLRGTREGLWRELVLFLEIDPDSCATNEPPGRCEALPSNCAPVQPTISRWEPPPLILEHFKLRRWLFLGAGRIGDQAVIWGNRVAKRTQLNEGTQLGSSQLRKSQNPLDDPFDYYAHKFTVFVPACYQTSESNRKSLENLLRNARPATTLAQVQYVEPRFRIGFQSMIGFDSVIARYPAGVTLDRSTLGDASVLTRLSGTQGPPSTEIGTQSRIGMTTKLN